VKTNAGAPDNQAILLPGIAMFFTTLLLLARRFQRRASVVPRA
jgi:hypothetical protein